MKLNGSVMKALCKRDLARYFSNPSGYVFITLFIFLSAAAAFWQQKFFLDNLANLDQLNRLFPLLLVFFVPSLTMAVWAEEKKSGTEELLLSLPANKLSIVIGKYGAALGIYSASLLLSMSHIIILKWLGNPDMGLMFGNYLGYWLMGAALIAIGMAASLFSKNNTISFILGALFCGVVVYLPTLITPLGDSAKDIAKLLSTEEYFLSFSKGIIAFSGIIYFASLLVLGLYINAVLLSKYQWSVKSSGVTLGKHFALRTIALVVGLIGVNIFLGNYVKIRFDVTEEKLYSLSPETISFLKELPNDKPVTIRAYISKEVPTEFVQTRSNLIGFLREIDVAAGPKVKVVINDTKEFSKKSREAQEQYNITPKQVATMEGTAQLNALFLGLAITSGTEEQVIPFFDRGLPVEYELMRSIKVVTTTKKKKVGVLTTKLELNGNFDFATRRQTPEWQVIKELKKQYEVVTVSAQKPIDVEVDGLFAALPSTLEEHELDNLKAYILAGNPTLLMVDPLPLVDPELAPSVDPNAQQNPFMQRPQEPKPPKGDIEAFMADLGITWGKNMVAWDKYNPHPKLNLTFPEIIFAGEGNENPDVFNTKNPLSSGLQEVVFLFPGVLSAKEGTGLTFESLIETGKMSGTNLYSQYFQRTFFGNQLNPHAAPHNQNGENFTLMAKVSGEIASDDTTKTEKSQLNLITIADIDFISEQFFELRKSGVEGLNFDNVSLFLNSIDLLVGDSTLVSLRKKRAKHRTLQTVEDMKVAFVKEQQSKKEAAEAEAEKALADANRRLKDQVDAVQNRTDLDEQTKEIMARNAQETESKRFEARKNQIEAQKSETIRASEEKMVASIREIQNSIKLFAVVMPPIPVFLLGLFIFLRRRKREKEGAIAARRLKE